MTTIQSNQSPVDDTGKYTRLSRRRNVSFYQQHIYTIDSVAYILRISLEEATAFVKSKPEIIDYYHNGTLRRFLLHGDKPLKTKQHDDKHPTTKKSKTSEIIQNQDSEVTELQTAVAPDEEELYTDFSASASEESSEESSDEASESDEDPSIKFRGRVYKDYEALSRGSKLPRSFFALNKAENLTSRGSQKRSKTLEDRVGLAKKKKMRPGPSQAIAVRPTNFDDGLFTVSEESQEFDEASQDISQALNGEPNIPSRNRTSSLVDFDPEERENYFQERYGNNYLEVEEVEAPGKSTGFRSQFLASPLKENFSYVVDDELNIPRPVGNNGRMMFEPKEAETTKFYRTTDSQEKKSYNDDYWEVEEDTASGIDTMLSSKSRKGNSKSRTKRQLNSSSPTRSRSTEEKSRKFRRNPSGTARKIQPLSMKQSHTGNNGPKKIYRKSYNSRQIKDFRQRDRDKRQQRQQEIYDFDIYGEPDGEKNDAPKKDKTRNGDKRPKKNSNGLYFLAPSPNSVLPRSALVSTVVYEGLSGEVAVLKRKNAMPRYDFMNKEVLNSQLPQIEETDVSLFQAHFANSIPYKKLFTNERVELKGEYRIVLGSKMIFFSKLNSSFQDSLKKVFDLLLNPSTIRNMSNENLIDSLIDVIEACSDIEVNQVQSLIIMVDSFRFQVDAEIRRKGQIKDVQFYYLSFCYMLYYCCFKVHESNYLKLFNFREKAEEITTLYFEYVSYIDSSVVNKKLIGGHLLFLESITMLFLTEKDITWLAVDRSDIKDLTFLKQLCILFQPRKALWGKIRRILNFHLCSEQWDQIKSDFNLVSDFVTQLGWKLDEDTLVVMFESLKKNKFQDFPNENNFPVIFSLDRTINRDSLNIYLNLLLQYGNSTERPSVRLLEKIIPLSKSQTMSVGLFCNRINILLTLSVVFKKNLDFKVMELVSSCEPNSKILVQRSLRAIQVLININNGEKLPTSLTSLRSLIDAIISVDEIETWKNFVASINFGSLVAKTQKNFLSVIATFKHNKTIINSCSSIIKTFISRASDKNALLFFKERFGDLNSSLFPELWCFISGELVDKKMENWSRLIHFNNFDDETYVFTYILKHSGVKIYQLEKDIFINSLLKNIVKRKYSPSLNSYIKELEKLDPKLSGTKNLWIQTHRLQITIGVVASLLKSDSMNSTARYLSLLASFLKLECDLAINEGALPYLDFAKKVTEFINIYGFQYVSSSNAFDNLCRHFKISRKTTTFEEIKIINFQNNIQESLRFVETKLLDSISNGSEFSKFFIPILLKHTSKKFGSSDQISDSKLYSICCALCIHIDILKFLPSCWIILNEITSCVLEILKIERNLSRIDMFCILKAISLFQFVLSDRNSRYLEYELLTLRNMYKILYLTYFLLSGTNDQAIFIEIAIPFMSRNVLYENYVSQQQPKLLLKTPGFIKDMVIRANLTSNGKEYSIRDLKSSVEAEFNNFFVLIDDYYEDNSGDLYLE